MFFRSADRQRQTQWRFPTSAEPSDVEKKRSEARRPLREQFQVVAVIQPGGERFEFQAWSYDVSPSGICFRCRAELPEAVEIISNSGKAAWVEIRRRREIAEGVWEYGARVCARK